MLTQQQLKSEIYYNPLTGIFSKKGKTVGSENSFGYITVFVCKRYYLAHRLAFLYMLNYMPKAVDHKDRNKLNNKWDNLREATSAQNSWNVGVRKNNTTGYKGVGYIKKQNVWMARACHKGVDYYLGVHATPELASKAYEEFAKNKHDEFYCSNINHNIDLE